MNVAGKPRIDMTGQQIGEWEVLRYVGGSKWECRCSCGHIKNVLGQYLRNGKSKSCGHNTTKFKDLTGQKFGEWEVLKFKGNHRWLCKCSCGNIREVQSYYLTRGKSKSCGHNTNKLAADGVKISREFKDLTGERFGEWRALRYKGDRMWECVCSCGEVRDVSGYSLTSGKSKSCGHGQVRDLRDQKFGRIKPLKYLGGHRWKCVCDCGNETIVFSGNLLKENGTKSCGCIQTEKKPTKEEVMEAINKHKDKYKEPPYIRDLEVLLNRGETVVRGYIDEYELHGHINYLFRSRAERDIALKFDGAKRSDRSMVHPYELDIYIPDKKLAIEFNGTYWHSEAQKDRKYHQNKTIRCAKAGVRLIHIFEYEWEDEHRRQKIETFLDYLSKKEHIRIYGRNTTVKEINPKESAELLDKHHLQGSAPATIHIGCYHNDQLVGVMTLGKPRFNSKYQYEIVRLCFRLDTKVIGGTEKLFRYFINKYKPESIITYCDISKFTGNVYTRIGFRPIQPKPITDPNYVWANPYTNEVIPRYRTQKHLLVKLGLGSEDMSESEILHSMGFYRIYDSGHLRLEWHKTKTNINIRDSKS